tara:strand:- start:4578 stop:5093 length:516 start_codon:yes stop_codon:yes gene_type:complete
MEKTEENFDKLIAEMEAKEAKANVKDNPIDDSDPYYAHIDVMQEEGLEKSDLPKEIGRMITVFNRKKSMAEKHTMKPETLADLQNLSVIIADKIQDYLEEGLDPEKKSEGGHIADADAGGEADSLSDIDEIAEDDDDENEDDEDEDEDENKTKEPKKSSSEWGILGGIFDW